MKNLILFTIFIVSLFTSCQKSFIQIFDTATTNIRISDDYYIFENDTVKITYSFWASQGIMSFSVYNKLNKPIYVDWKNSSYIVNDKKLNYWIDETQSNQAVYYGAYYYSGPVLQPGFTVNEGIQLSTSSTVKPERITFIPPKSYSTRSQFYLLPVNYFKLGTDCNKAIEPRNDKSRKKTKVYSETFELKNSPLRFRNFIAISFTENSQEFRFIDNEFYMISVREMDYRHYRGKYLGKNEDGKMIYEKPFKKKNSFYIEIDNINCYEWRAIKK